MTAIPTPSVGGQTLTSNTSGGGASSRAFTLAPIRYSDGAVKIEATDLDSFGFGSEWGVSRSWSNEPTVGWTTAAPEGAPGLNWNFDTLPTLTHAEEWTSSGSDGFVMSLSGTEDIFFQNTSASPDTFNSLLAVPGTLTEDSGTGEFTYFDPSGDKLVFNPWDSYTDPFRGYLKSFTDPSGITTTITRSSSGGYIGIESMSREYSTGGHTYDESLDFANDGSVLNSITLNRSVDSGTPEPVRSVHYTYYSSPIANALETATIEDEDGNPISTDYYRYYTSDSETGYTGALKYVFSGPSFARLTAAMTAAGTTPLDATDAQIAPFADNYFEYNSFYKHVTKEVVGGTGCSLCTAGLGTYTYSYVNSAYTGFDFNVWRGETTETLPDDTTNVVYSNVAGEPIMEIHSDGTDQTRTYWRYDDQGRVILEADPSAVNDDFNPAANADVIGFDTLTGNADGLKENSGLIHGMSYYSSNTASDSVDGGAAGYVEDEWVQQGTAGTPINQTSYAYKTNVTGTGIPTVYALGSVTNYQSDASGGSDPLTTEYNYTWFTGTARVQSETVTDPIISTTENGPGGSTHDTETTVFNSQGLPIWTKDADGFITYTQYDPFTGAAIKTISDVDTTQTSTFSGLPTGWSTPTGGGSHLTTTMLVDDVGRTIQQTDPNGNVTLYVYDDIDRTSDGESASEMRVYPGWNSSSHTTAGPITVYRQDSSHTFETGSDWHSDAYAETLTMAPSSVSVDGDGRPTIADDDSDITNVQTDSRDYTNDIGQDVRTDSYFLLPTSWSADAHYGTQNTNFYTTLRAYDQGHIIREETPNLTITRYVYDSLQRLVSTWVGTDDTATTPYWSPTNTAGTNLVKISDATYDIDGNQITSTSYPGGGADARVTQTFYDWRDRPVIVKEGAQSSESDDVHRLLTYYTYNNLDQVTSTETYAADGTLQPQSSPTPPSITNPGFESGTGWSYSGGAERDSSAPSTGSWDGYLPSPSRIQQSVSGWSAGTYTLTLSAESLESGYSSDLSISIDGQIVDTFTPPSDSGYASHTTPAFTVTSGTHTIAIVNNDIFGSGDAVDDVSLASTTGVIVDSDGDGVPDRPDSSLLRSKHVTLYDNQGRVYESKTYSVDPDGVDAGDVSTDALKTDTWYDRRGDVIKTSQPGGLVYKYVYDGDERLSKSYTTDGGGDTAWGDASNVTGDVVLEQTENKYDGDGNIIFTIEKQRYDNATHTGELGNPSSTGSTDKARVYYTENYYDALDRLAGTANLGTNGGTALTARPDSVLPSASDDKLTTSYVYQTDEIQTVQITGSPDGGTFTLTFDGQTTSSIDSDASPSTVQSDLEALSNIGSGNASVTQDLDTGIYIVTFTGAMTMQNVPQMTATSSFTGGTSPDVSIDTIVNGSLGWLVTTTDPRGITSMTNHDMLGRTIRTIAAFTDGIPGRDDNQTTEYTYDGDDHVTSMTAFPGDGTTEETQYVYGLTEDITSLIRYGTTATATSDGHGFQVGESITISGADQSSYDGTFTITAITTDTFSFTVSGSPTSPATGMIIVRPAGNIANNDLLSAIVYPSGYTSGATPPDQQETFTYNALGEKTTDTDRNGNVHSYSYDVLGRLVSDGVTTLGSGVDGTVRRRGYTFDSAGRPYQSTSYSAASGGSVVNQVEDLYNGLGQLITEYQEHSGAVDPDNSLAVQYSYTEMSGDSNNSRLTTMSYPNGRILHYAYSSGLDSDISRLSYLADDNGSGGIGTHLEEYSYLGLDTAVIENRPEPGVSLTYVKAAGDTVIGDAGDQYKGLDRFGRVIDQRWTTGGGTDLDRFQYGYDHDSNVMYKDNLLHSADSELYHSNGSSNGYDLLNRLHVWSRGDLSDTNSDGVLDTSDESARGFSYDALGNRVGDPDDFSITGQNEETNSDYGTPDYDANGNLTGADPDGALEDGLGDGGGNLTYDAWNRLMTRTPLSTPADAKAYEYDALGRLIQSNAFVADPRSGHGEEDVQAYVQANRDLYYDQSQVIEERNIDPPTASGSTLIYPSERLDSQYVWSPLGPNQLILRDRDTASGGNLGKSGSGLDERLYAQQDANLNITSVVNASGSVVERYLYDPYGQLTVDNASWGNRGGDGNYAWTYFFQDGRYDTVSGLYHFGARDYGPVMGRWMEQDPAGYVDGANLYQFVKSSPVDQVDPSGLEGGYPWDPRDPGWQDPTKLPESPPPITPEPPNDTPVSTNPPTTLVPSLLWCLISGARVLTASMIPRRVPFLVPGAGLWCLMNPTPMGTHDIVLPKPPFGPPPPPWEPPPLPPLPPPLPSIPSQPPYNGPPIMLPLGPHN